MLQHRVSLLVCLVLCRCAAIPSTESTSCGHPANKAVCFEPSVPYKVVLQEADSAVLRCVIRNLNKQVVTWMKNDGRDIPMTIGRAVFTPDARISVDSSAPDEWNLVIRRVERKDSGEYLCQVNGRTGLMAQAYALVVEESKLPRGPPPSTAKKLPKGSDGRLLSDDHEEAGKAGGKSQPSVNIVGDETVFQGTRYFPLTCTARYATRDAKVSPAASVEWYHQGVRQVTNVSSMEISMSWTDSDRAVSVLTIYSVQLHHSGEWVCLKRPMETGLMETATHSLTVLVRDSGAAVERKLDDAVHVASASLGIAAVAAASSADAGVAGRPSTALAPIVTMASAAALVALNCFSC